MAEGIEVALIVARLVAGSCFVWSGSRKLGDVRAFWRRVTEYRIVGPRGARVVAALLPPIELIAGLLFAAGFLPFLLGSLLLAVLVVVSTAMTAVLARGIETDCGCGGRAGSRVRPALLIRTAALALAVVAGMTSRVQPQVGEVIVASLAGVVCLVVAALLHRSIATPDARR